jgi:hypothetical protein
VPPTPLALGTSPVQFNRETMWYASVLPLQAEAPRYHVMVLQSAQGSMIPVLRRYNPGLGFFMYQHAMFASASDPTGLSMCTTLPQDLPHPTWFLKDATGANLTYHGAYALDVGNPGYQQACISHAVGLARKMGFDGVFFDGVGAKLGYNFGGSPNMTIPEYPTVASFQAAMYSFIAYAGPTIHAGGKMVIANIGGATWTPGLWQQWNGPLDGAEEESWTDGGQGPAQQLPWWGQKLGNVAWSEANGKIVLLHSYNTTQAGNVYGLASMLLVAGGRTSYSTSNGNIVNYEAWYPEYLASAFLGAPLGSYRRLSNGVYERHFAGGVVAVNPSSNAVGPFSLGGGPYSGSGLNAVSSVSMGPMSGLIMLGHP